MNKLLINEEDLKYLKKLSHELNTQENRCTSYPVWRLLKIKKCLGFNKRYADGVCIINTETDEIFEEKDELIECILSNAIDIEGNHYKNISDYLLDIGCSVECVSKNKLIEIIECELGLEYLKKEWYKEIHELEGFFLTESGFKNYMEKNKHNFNCEVYEYVDSLWNNQEMIKLIDIIKQI